MGIISLVREARSGIGSWNGSLRGSCVAQMVMLLVLLPHSEDLRDIGGALAQSVHKVLSHVCSLPEVVGETAANVLLHSVMTRVRAGPMIIRRNVRKGWRVHVLQDLSHSALAGNSH